MRSILFASLIALAASSARAFDVETEMQRINICQNIALVGEQGYKDRSTGDDNRPTKQARIAWYGGIMLYAYDYGHDKARDQRAANLVPFDVCLRKLYKAAKRMGGPHMTEEEVADPDN